MPNSPKNIFNLFLFIFSLFFFASHANADQVTPYNTPQIKNNWEIPEHIKPDPNYETLVYYLTNRHLPDYRGFDQHLVNRSEKPRSLPSATLESEFLKRQMSSTPILSYLMYDRGVIVYDRMSDYDRFGKYFSNNTPYRSNSIGKSLVSYLMGHAICQGYIQGVESRVDDWPTVERTLYHNQKIIDLLNMRAGDQQHVDDAKGLLSSGRWTNVHSIKSFADNELLDSSRAKWPLRNEYNYNGLVTNVIMNYIIHKMGSEDFDKLLDEIFREKIKVENPVFFYKNRFPDSHYPSWFMFHATRYDYLRIAIAIMEDWQNDTCVGQYLKEIHAKRINKTKDRWIWDYMPHQAPEKRSFAAQYGGQFHFSYVGMKNRNIFGLDGYGGQQILIDMDNSRIVVVNTIHTAYNWYELVYRAIKDGKLKN